MIYVASSWRNELQPAVVQAIRTAGFEVYDFHHPQPGDNGFHWSEIDLEWKKWTPEQFRSALSDPVAVNGFDKDMDALNRCVACVLVLPCGRSAHLELGQAVGSGKRTAVLLADGEPELMYKMVDTLCVTTEEVLDVLQEWKELGFIPSGAAWK